MKGKFIIIEGSDGSGKTTQLKLLATNLKKNNINFEILDFPQYYSGFWGKTIARFLNGEFGQLDSISPYLIQPYYMLDQASRKEDIKNWKNEGKYIISNRYITSSMAHQTPRLPISEHEDFLKWLEEAGYNYLGLEKEDAVIVLYVPPEISFKLLKNKDLEKNKIYKKNKKDITEENFNYLKNSAQMYKKLCKKYKHWHLIECIDKDGKLKSKEEINNLILEIVKKV